MKEENLDTCPACGKRHGHKKLLGLFVEKEALDSLKLIQNKYACACQAAQPMAIPDGTPKDKAEMFIAGALAAKAEAQWLQQMWWAEIFLSITLRKIRISLLIFLRGSYFCMRKFLFAVMTSREIRDRL